MLVRWIVKIGLAVAVMVALVAGWHWMFPDEATRIRRQFDELAGVVRIAPDTTPLNRLAKATRILTFLDPEITVNVNVPGRGIERVRGESIENSIRAVMTDRAVQDLEFVFLDIEVDLADDSSSLAQCSLNAIAHLNGERYWLAQEWTLQLRKHEGRWRILQVNTVGQL